MSNEMNPNDPRNLWQLQEVEKVTITVQELKFHSARFERRIHWRNVREYAGGALVIAMLAPQLWRSHGWRLVPGVLMLLGTLYVMFELYRRGSARPVPSEAGAAASLEFHRREMERQRDALKSVWRWYLLPLLPGLMAVAVAVSIDHGIDFRVIGFVAACVVLFTGIWALNEWAARKLDRKIQELKAMEAKDE